MENRGNCKELIQANYNRVLERVAIAAHSSGRQVNEIHLVVVTKKQPIEMIQWVIDAGATDLGENYAEEAVPKIQVFASNPNIRWHMIGHIQSRKAQNIVDYFQYVHSLDSLKLAERLSKFAVEKTVTLPAWLELNVGGEETKSGWDIASKEKWEPLLPELEKIITMPGLKVWGVMAMPPYSANPEASRPYYRLLAEFRRYIIARFQIPDFSELSMGMSGDFEVAIQEGATWIRVGQAILGPRSSKEG